jgi:hypothetical protein
MNRSKRWLLPASTEREHEGRTIIDRRTVLKAGAAMAGVLTMGTARAADSTLWVRRDCPDTVKTRLAVRELQAGCVALGLAPEVRETRELPKGARAFVLRIDQSISVPESFKIASEGNATVLRAGDEQGLLYCVFELLERQGMLFGIDGALAPIDRPRGWVLPVKSETWQAKPLLTTRGLLPWPDFLNCVSIYNQEDFRAYFAAMLRMRFNTFGMHVYTDNEQPTESYLSVDFAGVGQQAVLETTAMRGWGYLPQRTSTYRMGSAEYFDRETFGSDAARLSADNWEIAERTTALLRDGLNFARDLGIRTGVGFEPYKVPAAISDALPPEALTHPAGFPESHTAKRLLETRLADLLERYPSVDYVWLWEDETSNWQSRGKDVPISPTAFLQAHDFLRRHAPGKRLVAAGWGGFTRHFAHLHRSLPGDVIFSALGNSLGWDPVAEEFAALGDRERWPIPWLEDDPSMWFPQFRASRLQDDLQRAKQYKCQGMMGIHWRHRIVDPTATYFARAAWSGALTAKEHYSHYARSQAGGSRSTRLAGLLVDCDMGHAIASTNTGRKDAAGFTRHIELAADYQQGFKYWENEPDPVMLVKQRSTADQFASLAAAATTPMERERLAYLAGFVGFMVPYCDAYQNAHALNAVLLKAADQRKSGNISAAEQIVRTEGLPLWTSLAPQVRSALLKFQAVVATRNDLGQLASMQNKVVRIALERLRLSLAEFVTDLPPAIEAAYTDAIAPEAAPGARIFLPTRPSILRPGESLRLYALAVGFASAPELSLQVRSAGDREWSSQAARHEGRGVFSVALGPFAENASTVEYRLVARGPTGQLSDPASGNTHVATIVS